MAKEFTEMSIRAYAETKGVGESSIRKMRGKRLGEHCFGMNAKGTRPVIYKELADLDWEKNFDPTHTRNVKGKDGDDTAAKNSDLLSPGTKAKGVSEFTEKKTQRENVALQLDLLKLQEMKRKLVQKDKVYNLLFGFGSEIRSAFQDIPDQVTDDVIAAAASGGRDEVYRIIASAVDAALLRLANVNQAVQL